MEESIRLLTDHFPLSEVELRSYSALALAYVGDSIYELLIRTRIVSEGNDRPVRYHEKAVRYVNASAQTRLAQRIMPLFTEQERTIFRRGRNAKPISPPKNQSLHDYRMATGFEAVLGYLYLSGGMERIAQLLSAGLGKEGEGSEQAGTSHE